MEIARRNKIITVAMTRARRSPMLGLADYCIAVPHTESPKIQEAHIVFGHILCALIEHTIYGERS
jgi:D-sedoheptulose 7-phosphate isomerase